MQTRRETARSSAAGWKPVAPSDPRASVPYGCPICGDYLYGRELPELKDRFALHSARLRCIQPVTGETVNIVEPMPGSDGKTPLCIKIPLPRHDTGIKRRQGEILMVHQSKSSAKAWNPPAQKGKPRTGEDVASTTECTGLTPTEPEDLEEAYALGRALRRAYAQAKRTAALTVNPASI